LLIVYRQLKDAVKRLNNIAPNIKTEVAQNAGHCLLFTHPEIVNEKTIIHSSLLYYFNCGRLAHNGQQCI
jgi:hypothetical protein